MDLGIGSLPWTRPVLGHRDVEELVGGDVETSTLQLVEQSESRAADVGGVAPAHLVGAVDPRRRADTVGDRPVRRRRQRPHGTTEALLGHLGIGERQRRRQRASR